MTNLILAILITIVVLVVLVLLFNFIFPLVRVEGDSMLPTFTEGEYLRSRRVLFKKHCKVNSIYVIHLRSEKGKPYYVIKRLSKILPDNSYWFLGDNSRVSFDSRYYGGVPYHMVVSKIIVKKEK